MDSSVRDGAPRHLSVPHPCRAVLPVRPRRYGRPDWDLLDTRRAVPSGLVHLVQELILLVNWKSTPV
jgi:hypothetical protein